MALLSDAAPVEARVRAWVRELVVGLNLCPFARPVVSQMRVVVSPANTLPDFLCDLVDEARRLVAADPAELSTTLVVADECGLDDFDDFLDAEGLAQALLVAEGFEGVIQMPSFHPDFLFEGEPEDGVSHFTNRAPYPIFHLLREADVDEAVASHKDTVSIPEANIARLEALGRASVERMLAEL